MEYVELNEGIIDSIHDFFRSNGIMKTEWRGKEIKQGAADLSEISTILHRFRDDDLLRIVKVLHKRDGEEVFNYAGFYNAQGKTRQYTFLDIAITNANTKTLSWLLDNVSNLYVAGEDTISGRRADNLIDTKWLVTNGVKFFNYLLKNNTVTPADGFSNHSRKVVVDLINNVTGKFRYWKDFDKNINGIMDTSNKEIHKIMLECDGIKKFAGQDDVEFVKWVLSLTDIHWMNDVLIRKAPRNGKVQDFLNNDKEIQDYVYSNMKKLKLQVEDWLSDEAKDIFLF